MSSSATDRLSTANPRRVLVEPTPVVGVRFADGRIYLAMQDGREIGAPIEQFPRLANATDMQRAHWRCIGRGLGVHWPDIDEDLSVAHLLGLSD
ncbi:MAG: DUF2442 domain-containing protein [Chloroflexi bacterium]|nr:DUF2442 domain-containing protein [Chloroflexota bacterium]MBV9602674.1 DUF2442 domain-containing protein [Chloroflexota bacterium]